MNGGIKNTTELGVYIHWPFCKAKCPYCDFNSHVRAGIDEERWRQAYVRALEHYADMVAGRHVTSVFFGGGTPSLMEPETASVILETIDRLWGMSDDVEVTLEANPTSVESGKFKGFRSAGINRVSLGVQSLVDKDLAFLGREHTAAEALKATDIAQQTFERFSFDMMYARPDQTLDEWEAELKGALPYVGGHMSLYQLTIERSTPFYMDHAQGKFVMPDDDLSADFYLLTQDIMETAGLSAYEVSNHAVKGQESRHNLLYWRYGEYIGVGPGAHGRIMLDGRRFATREHRSPELWLDKVLENGCAAHPFEGVSPRDQFWESLIMGLRLRGGVSLQDIERQTGSLKADVLVPERVRELAAQGWLFYDDKEGDESLVLSSEGVLRMNAIIPYILRDDVSSD